MTEQPERRMASLSLAPPDILDLANQLDAAERDATMLVAGLADEQGTCRPASGGWSISECLDHLATANRVYVAAMRPATAGVTAPPPNVRRPAKPGVLGGVFVRSLEPPPKWYTRSRTPTKIKPRQAPPLRSASADFFASQREVRAFLGDVAELDLTRIRFANPLVRGVRFSVATGLHVITAHERRHLLQAWNVRRSLGF
jgi:hypothetical protein